jgi:hypothetical protein
MSQDKSLSVDAVQHEPNQNSAAPAPARDALPRVPDGGSVSASEGTPPSNTVPNKYNQDYFKTLRWGIDSLYLSFPGQLFSFQESELLQLKKTAQADHVKDQALAQIKLAGHIFEVKDKGAKFFPYILEDNAFRIQLSKASSTSMPMAYVKVSSEYLTHQPVSVIVDDLREVLNELGSVDYMPKVSRIDLFVDFVSSYSMESWDRHAWVTRAKTINQYAVEGQFSGWAIGMGSETMIGRLYDKLLEIESSHKQYLLPLWIEAGWDAEQEGHVWRLEFELKREILSQFSVQALNLCLENLNGLWAYATEDWLKLTIPSAEDGNRSRWPIHTLWGYLSEVDFETDGGPLSRQFSPERIPSDRRLFDLGFSAICSLMARDGITDFYQGLEAYGTALYHYLNNRAMNDGTDFDRYVQERVAIKARRFNSILNRSAEDAAAEAEAYRRLSDGD